MGGLEESRCVRHRIQLWEARALPPPVPSRRCSLLETALVHCPCREQQEPDIQPAEQPTDLPSALAALEAERQRCRDLVRLNVVLREHLEITTRTNEELTSEVHELTEEWRHTDRSQSDDQHPQGVLESRLFVVSQWQQDLAHLRQDLGQLREAVCTDLSSLGGALAAAQQQVKQTGSSSPMERWNLSQQIAGDLNQQVEALNAENDRLQRALDLAGHFTQEERQALDLSSHKVDQLQAQVSELQAKLMRANDEHQHSREQESRMRAQLEEQRASMQRELEAVRGALCHMQELHEKLEADRDAHQALSAQLEQQARESTTRLESLLRESEFHQGELRRELSHQRTELLDTQAALLEGLQATSRAEALSQEMAELRQQLSLVQQEREAHAQEQAQLLAQRTAAHEESQRQARTERQALEEELQCTRERAEAHADTCRRMHADMDALQGQLSQERSARQEAMTQHDRQLAQMQADHRHELQQLHMEHEATCSRILQEQSELRQQLSEQLRQQAQACTELRERLHAEADAVHQRAKQLEALDRQAQAAREEERKLLGRGLCACRSQLLSLRRQHLSLRAQVSEGSLLQPQADHLREAARRLAEQERSWQERQRHTDEHSAWLQQQLEQAVLKSAKLEAEVAAAQRQLTDIRRSSDKEREHLQSVVEELRKNITQAVSEKDTALRDAADRFREAEALRAELAAECARLHAEHQEEQRAQRIEAEARLQREGNFWKAKVSLCESEIRSCRAEASQLQGQLREAHEQLFQEQATHRAQSGREAVQRNQDRTDWQRRLLHEGQGLHQTRLALSAARGKAAALEAHLKALAESRQRAEAALSSLLSALRCALGVAPSRDAEAGTAEDEQLVLSAVQGLVSRVATLASTKERLEAETERSHREQQELRTQLETSVSELRRLDAARDRLNTENEELRAQTSQQLEEVSRLRLELQTVRWERSSLRDQLQETQRHLELHTTRLQTARDPVLDAQVTEKEAELQLAEARLGRLQRYLASSQHRQAEKETTTAGDAATVHKVQRLHEQLVSERQQSERLAQRERLLEAQLQDAQNQVAALHDDRQRVCTELEMLRRDKSSLEVKFTTVAVQLAEAEAAKQRLHRQKASADEGQRLREENRWLEREVGRLRSQLSRSVDAIFAAPQPRTSTPKKREAPEGESLRHGQEHTVQLHQLEARLHTTLQLDVSRSSHPEGDHLAQLRIELCMAHLVARVTRPTSAGGRVGCPPCGATPVHTGDGAVARPAGSCPGASALRGCTHRPAGIHWGACLLLLTGSPASKGTRLCVVPLTSSLVPACVNHRHMTGGCKGEEWQPGLPKAEEVMASAPSWSGRYKPLLSGPTVCAVRRSAWSGRSTSRPRPLEPRRSFSCAVPSTM
ncbi:uncharacterized protein LOC144124450 isoform X3 [Amblyomma americanum]